jgi:hypothetical protein
MTVNWTRSHCMLAILASASMGIATVASAQQSGVSQPPQDVIEASPDAPVVPAKPSAAVVAQPDPMPAQRSAYASQPVSADPGYVGQGYAGQDGAQISTNRMVDPDGDIVHPRAPRPGELVEGSTIRVKLMERLSSTQSEKGQHFRGMVATDVLQDGRVLIPAGSGIDGRVTNVSSGHFGGHGSFRLKPDAVILPDGTRYELHAYTTGAPGSKTRIGGEGSINPGSRAKKNGIEYGAVVGTGAVAGAVLGGPVGLLTGSLIGAGMVTTHIMVDHPQAVLEPGATLLFTLTEPMNLVPPGTSPGN